MSTVKSGGALAVSVFLLCGSVCWAVPVQWSGNGHYYDRIDHPASGRPTWQQALVEAQTYSFMGVTGHLATITSQVENDFIATNLAAFDPGPEHGTFIGGFQPSGSPEPAGNWQWVTGEPWAYTNWLAGSPSNNTGSGNEDCLVMWNGLSSDFGTWNDMSDTWWTYNYIIEYDSPPSPVPEPMTIAMFGLGLAGLIGRRIGKRSHR